MRILLIVVVVVAQLVGIAIVAAATDIRTCIIRRISRVVLAITMREFTAAVIAATVVVRADRSCVINRRKSFRS